MSTQTNANFTASKKNLMLNLWKNAGTITIQFWDMTLSPPASVESATLTFGSVSAGELSTITQPKVTIPAGSIISQARIVLGGEIQEQFTFDAVSFPDGGDIIVSEYVTGITNLS